MPSVIQKKSYGSAEVFWLNKDLLDKQIEDAVKRLSSEKPEVEEVVLFGSYIKNRITVSSDVDVLIIVKCSDIRFIDRQMDYRDYFEDMGIGVDLFIYTRQEVGSGISWINQVLAKGKCLFKRR